MEKNNNNKKKQKTKTSDLWDKSCISFFLCFFFLSMVEMGFLINAIIAQLSWAIIIIISTKSIGIIIYNNNAIIAFYLCLQKPQLNATRKQFKMHPQN